MLFITGQYQVQLGFARALQIAFGQLHPYRWDPEPSKSKIHIYDAYPMEGLRYPAVIVAVTGGEGMLRGIGDEFEDQSSTEVTLQGACYSQVTTQKISGQQRLNVSLNVFARSSVDRAQVADWCDLVIRHFGTEKLRREGVEIQSMTYGAQTQELQGSDQLFRTSLNVQCLGSWQRELPVSVTQTLNAICITGIFTSLQGATYV